MNMLREPMTFNQAAEEKALEVAKTLARKSADYGSQNILGCPVGAEMGLVVRLFDKLNRLANLYKTGNTPSNESLEDTWKDIMGYGLIGMMLIDDTFKLPLDNTKDK